MNKKYGIGFFVIAFAVVLILSGAFQLSFYKAKEKSIQNHESTGTENLTSTDSHESVEAEGQAMKEDCYYLMEVNGYIVVYLSDKKTPYEYTDIMYDELPPVLREEIRNGKYLDGTDELYGFLENYSS